MEIWKKRNFSSSLDSYLRMILGGNTIGPGDVHFLTESGDGYETLVKNMGISSDFRHTDLATAIAALGSDNGDNLLIFPGNHLTTASITLSQNDVRLIGVGSPNQQYQPSTLTDGGIRLSCVTSAIAEILSITGHYVQMHNLGTLNTYDGASNIADIKIGGKNFYANRCSFRGGNGATQVATDGAGVPILVNTAVAGAGNGLLIENSVIGSSGNTVRSKGPGCLLFPGGAVAGFGMQFRNCVLSSRIETATNNNVGLVKLTANYAVDRELLFDNCFFYSFSENFGTKATYVFRDACTTTHQIVLKNCVANLGFTSWSDAATYVSVCSPVSHLTGGIGLNS